MIFRKLTIRQLIFQTVFAIESKQIYEIMKTKLSNKIMKDNTYDFSDKCLLLTLGSQLKVNKFPSKNERMT